MLSQTEENYLKAIFKLSETEQKSVPTNAIANHLQTSAASVTDMLKRLTEKGYTLYEKYKGVRLSETGLKTATLLIRRHRLWEVFMVEKLNFSWDEVHPIAEQLEHIKSEELINRLEKFLDFPQFDPHGDPIPDREGNVRYRNHQVLLAELDNNISAVIVGVKEHSPAFLKYVEQLGLTLGTAIQVEEKFEYDGAVRLLINKKIHQIVTNKVIQNLYVAPAKTV
ncbi:MAG: metal-dependent transcriptional regulator [Saprospiraceae bacterium]|nr:metal-dependent transcriptional regulator [Saprospiraceae bacterium]